MRFRIQHLLVLIAIVGLILAVGLSIRSAMATRGVVDIDHPNGTRLRVVQKFTYSFELFNTSIYFDDGDGQWRWYYYDHQDSYWGHAESQVDGPRLTVVAGKRKILLNTETGECAISQLDGDCRSYAKSDAIRNLPPELDSES